MVGSLLLVATPLGNLGDLSRRAAEALARADVVACEDSRRAAKLLAHLGLAKPLVLYADYNERAAAEKLIRRLMDGATVALVTDAGSPLVADPGFELVRRALARGVAVEAVPGPSAVHVALALSGLPPYPYAFLGYLPRKAAERRAFLARWAALPMTRVVFVTPHRVAAELADLRDAWGDVDVALGRELTKVHEEVLRGPVTDVINKVAARGVLKGELTLVARGAAAAAGDEALPRAVALARELVGAGVPPAKAAAVAAKSCGAAKEDIYRALTG